MMKAVLLLAFAVLVSGAPAKKDKHTLEELIHTLERVSEHLKNNPMGKEVFLNDLKTKGQCSEHMFCQAERELKMKVSGLTKSNNFRTDGILMRNLNAYNLHHGTACKPVAEDGDEILLEVFLDDLKKCFQKENRDKRN